MADQNSQSAAPAVTPGSASDSKPDLKMPPVMNNLSQLSGVSNSTALPPNLPVKPTQQEVPPQMPKPSLSQPTPSVGPIISATVPTKPTPTIPPPPPKSPSIPIAPTTPTRDSAQSSIRTMAQDIEALKKGQPPAGISPQKPPEKTQLSTPPPIVVPPVSKVPPASPAPPISVKLPESPAIQPKIIVPSLTPPISARPPVISQAKPLPPLSPQIHSPVAPAPKATVTETAAKPVETLLSVPPPSRFNLNPTTLIISLVVIVIAGFSAWFFIFYKPTTKVGESPSPSAVFSPTATPLPAIESVFSQVESVDINLSDDFFTKFIETADVSKLDISDSGLYRIYNPSTSYQHTFADFSVKAISNVPQTINSGNLVDGNKFYIAVMRKADNSLGYGLLVKAENTIVLASELASWQTTMTDSLKKLFGLNSQMAASKTFLENPVSYPGLTIYYRNFPNPNTTIDYAVVSSDNGENFLIFTNSREHIFDIVDRIQTIQP